MTQANSMRFLIVGAGGSHGATGNHVARQLLARGLRVRAFVRQADERADELRELGAEIAVGDIRDYEVVRATLDGVQRAYFTYPLADGLLLATATFAAAGKQTGLQSVVNMSQITARPDHASPAARQHWLAQRVLDWSGIGVTHLRPPFFLENLLTSPLPPFGLRARFISRMAKGGMPPSREPRCERGCIASRPVRSSRVLSDVTVARCLRISALRPWIPPRRFGPGRRSWRGCSLRRIRC
jgi:uncharacterized protein YbjT (DUF2867 family)